MTAVGHQIDNTRTIESSESKPKHPDMLEKATSTGTEIKVTENGGILSNLTVSQPRPQ